jgi:hypothetical protein
MKRLNMSKNNIETMKTKGGNCPYCRAKLTSKMLMTVAENPGIPQIYKCVVCDIGSYVTCPTELPPLPWSISNQRGWRDLVLDSIIWESYEESEW